MTATNGQGGKVTYTYAHVWIGAEQPSGYAAYYQNYYRVTDLLREDTSAKFYGTQVLTHSDYAGPARIELPFYGSTSSTAGPSDHYRRAGLWRAFLAEPQTTVSPKNGTGSSVDKTTLTLVINDGTTSYCYDANGNLTSGGSRTYTWDGGNLLSRVNGSEFYLYDADGDHVLRARVARRRCTFRACGRTWSAARPSATTPSMGSRSACATTARRG